MRRPPPHVAELAERVARLAGALRGLGAGADDRRRGALAQSDRYVEYFLATYWAGGAVNPVNIRWTAAEIAYSPEDCETRVLLVDDRFAPMVGSSASGRPGCAPSSTRATTRPPTGCSGTRG